MSIIQFSNVSFCYPTRSNPTLSDITFDIDPGDFVLISGPTGCGKTTLLKMLNGIIPHLSKGTVGGTLTIAGKNAFTSPMEELTREAGIIFQNPDDQIISTTVEEEIAFGLENMELDAAAIATGIDSALNRLGIGDLKYRKTKTLSGGQKQRTAIASQIALRPKILALDEPLSQLDPRSAREVVQCIVDLNLHGITVVMVEHRIADVARYANKVLLMDAGRVIHFGDMRRSFSAERKLYEKLGIQIPDEAILSLGFGMPEAVFDTAVLEKEIVRALPLKKETALRQEHSKAKPAEQIIIQDVHFGYRDAPIFRNLNLAFHAGESVALMGANGSGKTTLLSLIAGIRKPQQGEILFNQSGKKDCMRKSAKGMAGFLMQNPDLMLFCESVEKEMLFGAEHTGVRNQEAIRRVDAIVDRLYLAPYRNDAPFSLSAGQRLRTALGSVLTMQPPILLLDEPTTGQNQENITRIMETIQNQEFIKTVIFCTHDIRTAMKYADRAIVLHAGEAVYDGSPMRVFDNMELAEISGLAAPASMLLARNCGIEGFHAGAAELLQFLNQGNLC
jgi:energy-coupling factor transport system ATP-binding protein